MWLIFMENYIKELRLKNNINLQKIQRESGLSIKELKNIESDYKKADILKNTNWDKEDMSLIRVVGTLTNKIAVKGIKNPKVTDKVFMTGNHGGKHCVYREGFISKLNAVGCLQATNTSYLSR